MERTWLRTSSASSSAASVVGLRRTLSSSSTRGGSQNTILRAPDRGPVAADVGHLHPGEVGGVLARVADGGRGQDEPRLGAVERGHPPQPAQDVGHVAAEHPAVGVGLVDDHVAEVEEEVVPALVPGEQAHVDHVRVGEQHPGLLPGHLPGGGGGVAVVGGHLHLPAGQEADAAQLVLGERLGGVEVDGPGVRVAEQAVEHRQVEAQALAGGRPGGDHEVLAPLGRVPALGLVGPQAA